MIVYHTSYVRVESPDTAHSRDFLDFGRGFYLTEIREQAEKYAERFLRRNKEAWLNVYELNDNIENGRVLRFDAYDERWLDFVMNCRRGGAVDGYDMIVGGIADDKVFRTIDLYFSGDITKEEALRRLIYERPNMQICICADRILKEQLKFIDSIRL